MINPLGEINKIDKIKIKPHRNIEYKSLIAHFLGSHHYLFLEKSETSLIIYKIYVSMWLKNKRY